MVGFLDGVGQARGAVRYAALLLSLAACADGAPVTIGVVLGAEGERAAAMALADANARAGRGDAPLRLRQFALAFDPGATTALRIADSLVADPAVVAVVGHANSSASLAAAQVYNAGRLPQIAPTTTTPLFSNAGPFSSRLVASDEHQAQFLARTVAARPAARVALVYVNDDYGRALRGRLVEALRASGTVPAYEGAYVEGDSAGGPAELVRPIVDARPSLLLWIGRSPEYATIAPMLGRALPTLEVLASDGFGGPRVLSDTIGRFAGVRYVRLVDINRADSALQRVRAEYRGSRLGDLSDQAALTYDAVSLLAAAVREVGPDRVKIRDWLASLGRQRPAWPGITGPIAFVRGGDRAPTFVLATAPTARGPAVGPR